MMEKHKLKRAYDLAETVGEKDNISREAFKHIDQLEAENKELNEKVKRVEMYAEFCIECDRNNMNPLEFESYLNLNIK